MEIEFEGLKIKLQSFSSFLGLYNGVIVEELGFLTNRKGKLMGIQNWPSGDKPAGKKLLEEHPGLLQFCQEFLDRANKLKTFE